MPQETTQPPKVFISYSHDSPEHKSWVLDFSTKLRQNGIDVVLDQWDLSLGEDMAQFMERSVTEADWVLMICTESYTQKVDQRSGGVGYEAMIVTGELVRNLGTSKFIPVIRQVAENPLVPKSVSTRLYINLSPSQNYREQFNRLLSELHRFPRISKPPLGENPFLNLRETGDIIRSDEWRLSLILSPENALSIPRAHLLDCLIKSCCSLPLDRSGRRYRFPLYPNRSNLLDDTQEGRIGASFDSYLGAKERYEICSDGSARLTIQQSYASNVRAVQGDVVLNGVAHFWPFITRFWKQFLPQMHFLHISLGGITGAILSLDISLYVAINLVAKSDYESEDMQFLPASGTEGLIDLLSQTFHILVTGFSPPQGVSKDDFEQQYFRMKAKNFLDSVRDPESSDESP